MQKISLRKVKITDKKYFAKWWRDKGLIKLTSGILKKISDQEVNRYFSKILKEKESLHFIILLNKKVIGDIALVRRKNGWHETQITIGERKNWGKGYGTQSIKLLIKKARRLNITKIYLEVRPGNIRAIKAYEKCGFKKVGIKKYPQNKYLPETIKMVLNCE
jgi:RimJ/RimL family protein N-acetyltransferase